VGEGQEGLEMRLAGLQGQCGRGGGGARRDQGGCGHGQLGALVRLVSRLPVKILHRGRARTRDGCPW